MSVTRQLIDLTIDFHSILVHTWKKLKVICARQLFGSSILF